MDFHCTHNNIKEAITRLVEFLSSKNIPNQHILMVDEGISLCIDASSNPQEKLNVYYKLHKYNSIKNLNV